MSVGDQRGSRSNLRQQLFQIWLLALARAVINMSRNCMGPMIVAMSPEFGYTSVHKGQVLGAFAAGYMLPQVAGGVLADRIGAKYVLLLSLIVSGLSLLVLPLAADAGLPYLWWLIATQGFMCGPVFPAMQAMAAKWTYGGLSSYASAVAGAGTTAGSLLALGLTPPLCVRIGWRITCAAFGCACLFFSLVWLIKARSSPEVAPSLVLADVTSKKVPSDITPNSSGAHYVRVLFAPGVLVIFLVHSAQVAVRTLLTSWMPTYYNEVLSASSEVAALCLAIPEIIGMVCSLLGGKLARNLEQHGLSALACRRIFLTAGSVGMGLGLLAIATMRGLAATTAVLSLLQAFSNLHQVGFNANYLDVTKHCTGLVSGVGNSLASLASYQGALVTSSFLSGDSERSLAWSYVFLIFASSLFGSLAFYLPLARVTPVDVEDKLKCI